MRRVAVNAIVVAVCAPSDAIRRADNARRLGGAPGFPILAGKTADSISARETIRHAGATSVGA